MSRQQASTMAAPHCQPMLQRRGPGLNLIAAIMTRPVAKAHMSEFTEAPNARRGEIVVVERIDPKIPAWCYGSDGRGIKRRFPVGWFDADPAAKSARALRHNDATEIPVAVGESVDVHEEYGDWLLVVSEHGLRGWVPEGTVA